MITDYNDPIVTLSQTYKSLGTGVQPLLGACIIGPNYTIRNYASNGVGLSLTSLANYGLVIDASKLKYSYAEGLSARSLPMLTADIDKLDENSVRVFVKDALILYLALDKDLSTDNTSTAILNTTTILSGDGCTGVAVEAGDEVVVTLTRSENDTVKTELIKCYVTRLNLDQYNKYKSCTLSKSLFDVSDSSVVISSVSFRKTVDCYLHLDSFNLTTTLDNKKLGISPQALSLLITLNGISKQFTVYDGDFYVLYRYLSTLYSLKYGMLSSVYDIEAVLGTVCPLNPLAIAVSSALDLSNNRFVYFVALDSDPTDDINLVAAYSKALDIIAGVEGIHGVVPCTGNVLVRKTINSFVNKESSLDIPYFKFQYSSCDVPEYIKINIKDILVSSTELVGANTKILLTEDSLLYTSKDVAKGDQVQKLNGNVYLIVSTNYRNYIIVKGDQTGNFAKGDIINILDYTLTAAEKILYIIANKGVSDKRTSIVFADTARYNGYIVPNYVVAAALAGRRSSSYPHAPLSNIQMEAITTVQSNNFTASQYKQLGANGFWRVAQNTEGQTMSLRQLTSAAADDVNMDEQSIICSIDSVCLGLKFVGRNLVGNSNISKTLLSLLLTTISNKLLGYMRYVDSYIGPQITAATLVSVKQDLVFKDRVYALIDVTPPKPFNRFHMTVRLT